MTDRNDRILREFVQMIEDQVWDTNTSFIIQKVLQEICLRLLEDQK